MKDLSTPVVQVPTINDIGHARPEPLVGVPPPLMIPLPPKAPPLPTENKK